MININTLNFLDAIGIGADIDNLESYIIDYKQANLVADLDKYEESYLKLSKILREIKQSSVAFKDDTDMIEEEINSEFDKIFEKLPNRKYTKIYGKTDINLDDIKIYIQNEPDSIIDAVALPIIQGLNVKCTYINGYIYKINLIGDYYKYKDVTEELKDKVPAFIDGLSGYTLTECLGKITIFNNEKELQKKSLNIPCSCMRCLRTHTDINKLSIVLDEMFINVDDKDLPYNNQWDKIEYMRDIGLSVPHHALIRNIESETLTQALDSFYDYFKNIEETSGIIYSFEGYDIRDNSKIYSVDECSRFAYEDIETNASQLYESVVKSVHTSYKNNIKLILKILPIQCNDHNIVSEIEVNNLNDLNTYDFKIGTKIKFKIYEGKPELVKNRNK